MALHDFACPTCGAILRDIYRPISVGAQADPPLHCGQPAQWIPQVGRMDTFEPFDTVNGRNQPITIASLTQLRKVERESEQHYRNGEGQPLVWRMYSQDRSNRHTNTQGPDPGTRITPADLAKHHLQVTKHGEVEPSVTLGPGMADSSSPF